MMNGASEQRETITEQFRAWLLSHAEDLVGFRREPQSSLSASIRHEQVFMSMLSEAGWTRYGWPQSAGGLGGNPEIRGLVIDELYAAGYYLPEPLTFVGIIGPTLLHYAEHLACEHLSSAISGDEVWCQGFSEPDAGSDLASLQTHARWDGTQFQISGHKIWTSYGHVADRCLLLARTGTRESRHHGLTAFWIDMHSKGVATKPIQCANGRDELSELFLDEVTVPMRQVIGDLDGGWQVARFLLQHERGAYAWQRQGWLQTRFRDALNESFQGSTGSELMVADSYLAWVMLRATSRRILLELAAGEDPGAQTSIAKIMLSTAERVGLDTIRSLLWPVFEEADHERAQAWRRDWFYTRAASILGGAVEVQRDLVADRVAGLPRSQ
jgi:acyl-CoA dehydrogenase